MKDKKKLEAFSKSPNKTFEFMKMMKREGKYVGGGKWVRDIDGRLDVNDNDKKKRIWK